MKSDSMTGYELVYEQSSTHVAVLLSKLIERNLPVSQAIQLSSLEHLVHPPGHCIH